jgi:hypothetical protein
MRFGHGPNFFMGTRYFQNSHRHKPSISRVIWQKYIGEINIDTRPWSVGGPVCKCGGIFLYRSAIYLGASRIYHRRNQISRQVSTGRIVPPFLPSFSPKWFEKLVIFMCGDLIHIAGNFSYLLCH